MTRDEFEKSMERLYKWYPPSRREALEADPFYQKLTKSEDWAKAEARACEIVVGSAKSLAEGRRIRKDEKELSDLINSLEDSSDKPN